MSAEKYHRDIELGTGMHLARFGYPRLFSAMYWDRRVWAGANAATVSQSALRGSARRLLSMKCRGAVSAGSQL